MEVLYNGTWYELEGFIFDKTYLGNLQKQNSLCKGSFCGYGVSVEDFQNPVIEWNGNNTYIQSMGIAQDFGVFNSPDELLTYHAQTLSPFKKFLYRHLGRHFMNRNVKNLRNNLT